MKEGSAPERNEWKFPRRRIFQHPLPRRAGGCWARVPAHGSARVRESTRAAARARVKGEAGMESGVPRSRRGAVASLAVVLFLGMTLVAQARPGPRAGGAYSTGVAAFLYGYPLVL